MKNTKLIHLAISLMVLVVASAFVSCSKPNTYPDIKVGFIFFQDENSPYDLNFIDAAKAALMAGTRHVFDISTFTVGGQTVTSCLADVEDDGTHTGETEAIHDGYFHESEYRSAPYFELDIDGITIIL